MKITTERRFKIKYQKTFAEYITGLIWSNTGDQLAIISAAGELALWQAGKTNWLRQAKRKYSLDCLSFSTDSQWLATGGQEGNVEIWQLPHIAAEPQFILDGGKAWIDCLAWNRLVNLLAFGVGRQVKIWDAKTQTIIANLDFKESSVFSLAWHPQGDLLAVSGHGGVKIWHRHKWHKQPDWLEVPGASLDCAWSADGNYLASGNLDRTISLLHWDNPPPWLMQGFPAKVTQVAWSPVAPLLAATCQNAIVLWQFNASFKNWESYILEKHQKNIQAIAFAPHSYLLASASDDGYLYLWHKQGKISQSFNIQGKFTSLAWHPEGKYLAAGLNTGEVIIWQQIIK